MKNPAGAAGSKGSKFSGEGAGQDGEQEGVEFFGVLFTLTWNCLFTPSTLRGPTANHSIPLAETSSEAKIRP